MKIWNWFLHSIFDLPYIGYVAALGLLLTLVFFKSHNIDVEKQKTKKEETVLAETFIVTAKYGTVLLLGFIIQAFL